MTLNGLKKQLAAQPSGGVSEWAGPGLPLSFCISKVHSPAEGRGKLHPKMWWVFLTSTKSRSSCAAKHQQTTGPNQSLVCCLSSVWLPNATHNHSNKLIIDTILLVFGPSLNTLWKCENALQIYFFLLSSHSQKNNYRVQYWGDFFSLSIFSALLYLFFWSSAQTWSCI